MIAHSTKDQATSRLTTLRQPPASWLLEHERPPPGFQAHYAKANLATKNHSLHRRHHIGSQIECSLSTYHSILVASMKELFPWSFSPIPSTNEIALALNVMPVKGLSPIVFLLPSRQCFSHPRYRGCFARIRSTQ